MEIYEFKFKATFGRLYRNELNKLAIPKQIFNNVSHVFFQAADIILVCYMALFVPYLVV